MRALPTKEEVALPARSWRDEWTALLRERDHVTCAQQGPRGPPFATHEFGSSVLSRWMPWNWWSIEGTGWCFDGSWDEMRKCDELETSADWSGVVPIPDDEDYRQLPPSQLLSIVSVAVALAAHRAYQEWARQEARRQSDDDEAPEQVEGAREADDEADTKPSRIEPTVTGWLSSGQAVPWMWDPSAAVVLMSAMFGLLVGATLPLTRMSRPDLYADLALEDDSEVWPAEDDGLG